MRSKFNINGLKSISKAILKYGPERLRLGRGVHLVRGLFSTPGSGKDILLEFIIGRFANANQPTRWAGT